MPLIRVRDMAVAIMTVEPITVLIDGNVDFHSTIICACYHFVALATKSTGGSAGR
jgi:hypothetical protein